MCYYVIAIYFFLSEYSGCFEIRVPNTTDTYAKLHLQVKFSDSNYSINDVKKVNIHTPNGVTFIQTDREIYSPGQRVKIRILMLSQELGVPKNFKVIISSALY